jgi:citrate lyase subunit beta / citryl-CoA lyase
MIPMRGTAVPDAPRRPRRSALYLPGANARALEKARSLPADVLLLDLEDAVAPDRKAEARDRVTEAVAGEGFAPREVVVRVNGLDTPWFSADLAASCAAGPDAVLVPKVGSVADVRRVEDALEAAGAPDDLQIWAMLETPTAVLDARAIVGCSPRLAAFVVGTNDLAKELRAQHVPGRAPLLTALSWAVLAVREADKIILDGVYNVLDDPAGFEAECVQGRALGFDGKTLIHPTQVAPSNRIFAPSGEDVAHARAVITAFEQAERDGLGVVTVDGRLIEHLHVTQARDVLATAEAIAALEAREAREALED